MCNLLWNFNQSKQQQSIQQKSNKNIWQKLYSLKLTEIQGEYIANANSLVRAKATQQHGQINQAIHQAIRFMWVQ